MFLTYDRMFPMGAREEELLRIYRPRPGLPSPMPCWIQENIGSCGLHTPQQVDIDVQHPQGEAYLQTLLKQLSGRWHSASKTANLHRCVCRGDVANGEVSLSERVYPANVGALVSDCLQKAAPLICGLDFMGTRSNFKRPSHIRS